ncbi:MAG: hypothetical protein K2X62_11865, partial [Beijerinckiaceae bacterium]|nr:hypothetical protein [Beijerinckiaceae bacterium]
HAWPGAGRRRNRRGLTLPAGARAHRARVPVPAILRGRSLANFKKISRSKLRVVFMAQKGSNPPPPGARPAPPPNPPRCSGGGKYAAVAVETDRLIRERQERAERYAMGRGELPPQTPRQAPRPVPCDVEPCPFARAFVRHESRLDLAEQDARDLWLAAGLALVLAVVGAVLGVAALVVAW